MAPHFRISRRALMDHAIEAGLHPTLTAIASRLDVAPSTLSRALTGASVPGEDLLARIRLVFGTDGFDEIVTVVGDNDDPGEDAVASPDVW